jgi:hypothetical protein
LGGILVHHDSSSRSCARELGIETREISIWTTDENPFATCNQRSTISLRPLPSTTLSKRPARNASLFSSP